jgi:ADP-heptose:LPS heptosyltransferase
MNERIKELAKQAGAEFWQRLENDVVNPEAYITFDPPEGLEQFAELIVRECMKVAVNKDSGYIHPANVAGYMAAGRSTAAQMIKEHFGVEE